MISLVIFVIGFVLFFGSAIRYNNEHAKSMINIRAATTTPDINNAYDEGQKALSKYSTWSMIGGFIMIFSFAIKVFNYV